jgi:aspartate dehydrogenase
VRRKRIGLIGYGAISRAIVDAVKPRGALADLHDLAWIWARDAGSVAGVPADLVLSGALGQPRPPVDLVIEAAHPDVARAIAEATLLSSDLMICSPAAFADAEFHKRVREAARDHACFIPGGAAWGVQDIAKLDRQGGVTALEIEMAFPVEGLRLRGPLGPALDTYRADPSARTPILLYEGAVRALCDWAPRNVNTMACLALAAASLGFDGVQARLLAQKDDHTHRSRIHVRGVNGFEVITHRTNPAHAGAVTGQATFSALLESVRAANTAKPGLQFC